MVIGSDYVISRFREEPGQLQSSTSKSVFSIIRSNCCRFIAVKWSDTTLRWLFSEYTPLLRPDS